MATYYHISTDLSHNGVFIPRIPSVRHKTQEDSTIPRSSWASSIEDCLTAIPNGGIHLDELNINQRGYYLVFKIDTEKLGIEDNDIVSTEELFAKDLVRDAEATNEVWITKPFTVSESDRFIIKLITWEEGSHDLYPFAIQQLAEEKYEGNYEEAYAEIYGDFVPCCTMILDADYILESVDAGTIVPLYFEEEDEKEELKEILSQWNDIEVIDKYMDEIEIHCKKEMNLKEIFIKHKEIATGYC